MRNSNNSPRPGDGKPRQRPGGAPQRRPGDGRGRPSSPNNPAQNHPPRQSANPAKPAPEKRAPMQQLPMIAEVEEIDEDQIEGMTYFAYGVNDDDVAFEMCAEIDEALAVMELMREDGFKTRLFQAQEIEVVRE